MTGQVSRGRKQGIGLAFVWALLGGGAAYLLDPELGRRRRAQGRDRVGGITRRVVRLAPRKTAYATGRLRGLVVGATRRAAAARGGPRPVAPESSQYLAHKVSTELGRLPDRPRERLNVDAVDGIVHLRGRLDSSEQVTAVVERVRKVEGVRDVVSHVTTRA